MQFRALGIGMAPQWCNVHYHLAASRDMRADSLSHEDSPDMRLQVL